MRHHIEPQQIGDCCDRCPAEAHVLVLLHDGGQLVLCNHHANQHRAALTPIAVLIEHHPRFQRHRCAAKERSR